MNKILVCMAIVAGGLMAEQVVFEEDFSKFPGGSTRGIRETQTIDGHPVLKQALRLVTTAGGNKETPSWTSGDFGKAVLEHGPETVMVDYWIKPVTSSARYMLFVRDTEGRQMVGVLYAGAQLTPNDGGNWVAHSPLPVNVWHQIRYVIRAVEGTYDIYVDDLDKPRVAGLRFRYKDTTTPASLWIEGSETERSETLLGGVRVSVTAPEGYAWKEWVAKMRGDVEEKRKEFVEQMKEMGGVLETSLARRRDELQMHLADLSRTLASRPEWEIVHKARHELGRMEKELHTIVELSARYQELFSKKNANAQEGMALFCEDSTVKVKPGRYYGGMQPVKGLHLAQGETGSFQIVAITDTKRPLTGVDLEILRRDDLGRKLECKMFLVEDVATRMPGKPSELIPDVLRPSAGKETFKEPQTLVRLWVDVKAPLAVSGKTTLEFVLKTVGRAERHVTMDIEIYPFALPRKFSLSTAFCFAPSWAEAFYGKPLPNEKRRHILDFILEHRLDPMNLWNGARAFLDEEETRYCLERGMKNIYLPIVGADKNEANMRRNLEFIDKNGWRARVVAFGFDEVLFWPEQLAAMKAAFQNTKEHFPDIPRLNTARIDERLFGYVDIWCPLFEAFDLPAAQSRLAKGEQVWWYPTDYPVAPSVNFNLDSTGIAPRVIPWLTVKWGISGLLYWGLNREWLTNAQEHERLTAEERSSLEMDWMTEDVRAQMAKGLRWPAVPWAPYFRNVFSKTAKASPTNGGGNLMYPGPDFEPWPSTRLKNLRDGLQDMEYFHVLSNHLAAYEQRGNADMQLVAEARALLKVPDEIVKTLSIFAKEPDGMLAHKRLVAEMIMKLQEN